MLTVRCKLLAFFEVLHGCIELSCVVPCSRNDAFDAATRGGMRGGAQLQRARDVSAQALVTRASCSGCFWKAALRLLLVVSNCRGWKQM